MGAAQRPNTARPLGRRPFGRDLAGPVVLICGGVCIALGLLVMAAWLLDLARIREAVPGFVTMKMNTALCFVLSGAALLLHGPRPAAAGSGPWPANAGRRSAVQVLAAAVGLIAAVTLGQHAGGIDAGIDELLVSDTTQRPQDVPGRMSVITAICFLLYALALLLPGRRRWSGAMFSLLCTLGLVLSCLVLIGYFYRARALYEPLPATAMAIHAAAGLAVLFSGALMMRPDVGWVRICLRAGGVGLILRLLLPALVILPVLLGWLGLQGLELQIYGARGLMAWFVGVSTLLLVVLTVLSARTAAAVEDARRQQERLFSTVLNNSLDAFVMMDDGGRVLEWNAQAERIFGWTRKEAVGQPLDSLFIPQAQRQAHRAGIQRFLEVERGPMILERSLVTAQRRDETFFTAEVIVVPIENNGRWSFAGFIRDVSDQLALEEQLRQSQKMDAIGQLTGGIAHDLNNLLTVVIGNLDLLIAQNEERVRSQAEPAMQAAERGAALVHRLLAFSRRQALAPRRLALNELVGGIHELMARTLGEEVDMHLELGRNVWPVYADPGEVENALLNLALNARDAMPQGGRLTIETANAHLDADYAAVNPEVEPGDYVMVAVSDTGTGMAPEVVERAFEPFFTTKEVGKGSGLGLSMIYGFAKQSRGHLKIYSEVGHGTTLRLYLPRHDGDDSAHTGAADAPSSAEAGVHPHRTGESILVVEDDDSVRTFVSLVLERLGYRVLAAPDAQQALAVLASDAQVDLLFTDVVIPGGMSGRDLAESARAHRPGLKVLYTSGYTRNSIVHQGKLDRGVSFIAKPYKREELAAMLRAVLEGE